MEVIFTYGKCLFTKPELKNVDEMVEMMNNEKISSMLSVRKRTSTPVKTMVLFNPEPLPVSHRNSFISIHITINKGFGAIVCFLGSVNRYLNGFQMP